MRRRPRRLTGSTAIEETGELTVALEASSEPWTSEAAELLRAYGHEVEAFDGEAIRAEVASPTYLGGLWDRSDAGLLDPGKLTIGLARAAARLGVRIHEHTPARGLSAARAPVSRSNGRSGPVRARRALLATSAYPPLLRAEFAARVLPVYDYAMVTEPLDAPTCEAIGWRRRQGLSDPANRFHYYRLTADDRIVWGGYDAVYRYGGPVGDHLDDHEPSFADALAAVLHHLPAARGPALHPPLGRRDRHLQPLLGVLRHCPRRTGRLRARLHGPRVVASRFGASVALDLVDGLDTEATRLRYVRTRPVPFPPEPLRSAAVGLTQHPLAAADATKVAEGSGCACSNALGLGFDS